MPSADLLLGLLAGFGIAVVTTPVGVSGAVFLLPVQLAVLHVPNPAVTPTNLLFNVVAAPGGLWRYRRRPTSGGVAEETRRLTRLLLRGTVPGVVLGSIVRVHLLPGPRPFRVVVGAVLLAIGLWLVRRVLAAPVARPPLGTRTTVALAAVVGVVGGVYGIGGGSLLAPILVGSGLSVAVVAPAALASTFVTSLVGAATYAVLATQVSGSIAPDWSVGLACGLGGLLGGYVGARLQPHVPTRALTLLLGVLAVALGATYLGLAAR